MKPLKDEIRDSLAERFGIKSSELILLGGGREDSDGIVYTVTGNEKRQVLKISQAEDEKLVKSVLEFAHYLGSCGIHVSNPIRNTRGNIYEVAQDENTMYIATLMDFIEGRVPDANDLIHNEKLVYEWGKLTGKMHKTKNTMPIHHYASTWHTLSERIKNAFVRRFYKILGAKNFAYFEKNFNKSLERKIRKELP